MDDAARRPAADARGRARPGVAPRGLAGSGEPAWAQAVGFVEEAAAALGVHADRRAAAYAPWHPGRCAELASPGPTWWWVTPASCTRRSCAAFGLPARTSARRARPRLLCRRGARRRGHRRAVGVPGGQGGRGPDRRRGRRGGGRRGGAARRRRPLLESVELFDVFSGPQIGEGKKSLALRPAVPGRRPYPDRRRGRRRAGRRRRRGGADRGRAADCLALAARREDQVRST